MQSTNEGSGALTDQVALVSGAAVDVNGGLRMD
jgi:hypothetical protein